MDGEQIKPVIQIIPRVLLQSISTNIEPKISLLETVSGGKIRSLLQENPWLLTFSIAKLKQMVEQIDKDGPESSTVTNKLVQFTKGGRPRREILLMSDSRQVEMKFSCVTDAARHADTSQSNMYRAVREGRPLKGRVYKYAQNDTIARDHRVDCLSQPKDCQQSMISDNESFKPTELIIHTSGSAFPPEDTVRGRRRAGGMALQIRNWSPDIWRKACVEIWKGRRVRLLPDGQTVMLGFNYLRPSRPRCSLYACQEALRVASQWVQMAPSSEIVNIYIHTDSNYAVGLLQNSTKVLDWGRQPTQQGFALSWGNDSQSCDLYQANPDILYPLCRSYLQLIEQNASKRGNELSVQFLSGNSDDNTNRLRDAARLAAKLMHESIR